MKDTKYITDKISEKLDISNWTFEYCENGQLKFFENSKPLDMGFMNSEFDVNDSDIEDIILVLKQHYKVKEIPSKLYTYEIEAWFRYGADGDEKEFMTIKIVADNDEFAKKLAKETRRNIFKVEIKSKVPYNEPRL